MTDSLARVRWEMGQTLMPEHFIIQEESLAAETITRFRMLGLPDYGVARLDWNDTLLKENVFSIRNLMVVFPNGLLLKVPGNAKVSPLHLEVSGTIDVPVFLHVADPGKSRGPETGADEEVVPRKKYDLVLSCDQTHPDALHTLKIASFHKNPEGDWQLGHGYVPPLVQVGNSPFFEADLKELQQSLETFLFMLTQQIADSYLSGESLTASKQCMKSVYEIRRFLVNLQGMVHVHPYVLYEKLKQFYTEVCFYRNTLPEHVDEPYDHDRLAGCFENIFTPLRQQMQMGKSRSPYLAFTLEEGVFRISLPPETRKADEVYFLIQKAHASQQFSVKDLKVAGFSRISMVHKLALQGVPLTRIDRPPFQHSFGPEVDFYRIREGEEWDYALRDMTLAFYDPKMEGVGYYVYWRFE